MDYRFSLLHLRFGLLSEPEVAFYEAPWMLQEGYKSAASSNSDFSGTTQLTTLPFSFAWSASVMTLLWRHRFLTFMSVT